MTDRLLLRHAEIGSEIPTTGRIADMRVADMRVVDGRITEIAPALPRRAGEPVVDCAGAALLPGLVDHHLHLHALAAYRRSVVCGPPAVRTAVQLAAALATAVADEHGWVRGVGYHESVAGELDATRLDRLHGDRPVRIQHRGGALWMLNSRALDAIGLDGAATDRPGIERTPDGSPTGRLWRADAWLRERLPPTRPPRLDQVGAELTGYGITSVTDATPALGPAAVTAVADAMRTGALPQRVQLLGAPLDGPLPSGLNGRHGPGGGDGPDGPDRRAPTAGPYKIVLADSGLPTLDELVGQVRAAHGRGRAVAVHVVTVEALVLLIAALDVAGTVPGDRVEHAALVPEVLVPELARLGLRVVTQPGFLADRGDDYLRDVPRAEHPDLYRCRSLLAAGVPLALSSDAPYGPLDPWVVLRAATDRRTSTGEPLTPGEALQPADALRALLAPAHDPGGRTGLRPGMPADLLLLRVPAAVALADPRREAVRLVLIGGVRYDV